MTDLVDLDAATAHGLAAAIAAGELSPVEAVARAIERAHDVQPALNCFTAIWDDEAPALAERAAVAVVHGEPLGVLHGVPVAVKDTTPVAGRRTTLGSYAFEHAVAERDAYVVTALRRAGAIIVGQTTTPEFSVRNFDSRAAVERAQQFTRCLVFDAGRSSKFLTESPTPS